MHIAIWIPFVAAVADTGAAPAPAARSCGADSLFTRVPVYVHVTVATPADTAAGPSLLLIAESVATRIRAALGAAPDSVPHGERVVLAADSMWHRDTTVARARTGLASAALRVVVKRDGSLQWEPVLTPPSPLTTLLDRGLTEAKQAGDVFVASDVFRADSIAFTLGYLYRHVVVGGRVRPVAYGPGTLAAFTLRTAVEKQAAAVPGTIQLHYPEGPRTGRAEGVVIAEYVVDTTGQAVASSVRDVWPKDRARLTGDLGAYYQAFFRAAKDAIVHGRYYPAEIAGCKVRQLVRQPFTYHFGS